MAEENETNPMANLVQHALDQDYNKANKVFGDVMGVRINDILDQEKVKLADQIYNGVEPQEEEDDEQLELDLANGEETDEEDHEVEDDEGEEYEDEDEDQDYEEDEEYEEEDLDAHDG
tara:strand:- start:425 stop:778 length:354 start_codon:yes stop_codon:yes gene_type:complete